MFTNGRLLVARVDGDALYTMEVSELEGTTMGDLVNEEKPVRETFD